MNAYPTKLEIVEPSHLQIDWSDGLQRCYSFRELRDRCPCTTCREKRQQPPTMLPILTEEEMQPLRIKGMKPVGNYAYSIEISDGHDSGIYSFDLLLELGEVV
ncbi:MAG: DUF971 domain-containing protein [Pirellulaceae bacterium]|nr:DUF971 domain-containing protein [Pirellulaceae bacterium]